MARSYNLTMSMTEIRTGLEKVLAAMRGNSEQWETNQLEDVLAGTDEELEDFIVSNELWGGSGSIADQAGIGRNGTGDRVARRAIEAALADLGELQMKMGRVNTRTAGWVRAFRAWQQEGI